MTSQEFTPGHKAKLETNHISFRDELRSILEGLSAEQYEILKGYFKDRYENEHDTQGELVRERNDFDGEVISENASKEVVGLFASIPGLEKLFTEVRKTILVGASDEYIADNVIAESWIAFAHYLVSDREFNLTVLKNQDEIIGAISTRKRKFNVSNDCTLTLVAEENVWVVESYRNQGCSADLINQLYIDSEHADLRIVEVDKDDERAKAFAAKALYFFPEGDLYVQPKFEASLEEDNNTHFALGIHIFSHVADSLIDKGLLLIMGEESFKIQGKTLARLVECYARTFPGFITGDIVLKSDGGSGEALDTLLETSLEKMRSTQWIEFRL